MAVLLTIAVAKLVTSAAAWLLVTCATSPFRPPPWYYLALAFTFSIAGFALIFGGRREAPAPYLGGTFVLFATLFADRVLTTRVNCLGGAQATWGQVVLGLQPIAFIAFTFWRFAWTFPRVQPGTVRASFPRSMDLASVATGLFLFAANIAATLPDLPPSLRAFLPWLGAETDEGQFWLLETVLIVPALVVLFLKLRAPHLPQRRRLSIVIVGLAAGTLPMVADVLLTTLVPSYRAFFMDAGHARVRAVVLTLLALIAPASAAYAVVVEHVFDVRFVVRTAVRYSLARYFAFAVLAGPVVALALYMYSHRHQPLGELSATGTGILWMLVFASAAVLTGLRRPVLEGVDRHFFREEYDARRILSGLIEATRAAPPADVAERVCAEVDRALHLERAVLLVLDETAETFTDPLRRVRPLAGSTPLARLVGGADTPLDVDLSPRSTMGRLSETERQWLADSAARLLVPFLGTGRELIAILVLGDKRSDTPFTSEDRMLLMAIAASAALSLEAGLRGDAERAEARRDQHTSRPASQCEACGNIHASGGLSHCPACHGELRPCLLPGVLAGKFSIERRIGVGGMGVVYRAQDLDLGRPVALKTLPRVAPGDAARLRREARAMATIQHPNLAVIHAIEVWRGVPVLVLEYLAGGTLADRLRTGPLALDAVISIGSAIADVLDHVHRAGLLHRDVKPSNIGFTSDGVPKLLDFGLARLTTVAVSPSSTTSLSIAKAIERERGDGTEVDHGHETQPLVGTAAYLSPEAVALRPPDHSFDLWALAVTVYEAIAAHNPFARTSLVDTMSRISSGPAPDIRTVRPECGAAVAEFLAAALSPDPRRRPATAAEFKRRLQRARPAGDERPEQTFAALHS